MARRNSESPTVLLCGWTRPLEEPRGCCVRRQQGRGRGRGGRGSAVVTGQAGTAARSGMSDAGLARACTAMDLPTAQATPESRRLRLSSTLSLRSASLSLRISLRRNASLPPAYLKLILEERKLILKLILEKPQGEALASLARVPQG
jgi:hypothetical protein